MEVAKRIRKRAMKRLRVADQRRFQQEQLQEPTSHKGRNWPPEVVEMILRNLSLPEIKSCRLISKVWNEEGCRLLNGKLISRFDACQLESHIFLQESAKALNLPSVLDEIALTMNNLKNFQVDRELHPEATKLWSSDVVELTIEEDFEYSSTSALAEVCAYIIESSAPLLTQLKVNVYSGLGFLNHCLRSPTLPQLEGLEILLYGGSADRRRSSVELEKIQQLLRSCPKLRTVKANGKLNCLSPVILEHYFGDVESALRKTLSEAFMWEIAIEEHRPVLKSLTIGHSNIWSDTIRVLRRFAPALEFLHIQSLGSTPWNMDLMFWERDLPNFPRLQTLLVTDFRLGETWLRKAPAVKKLIIEETLDLSQMSDTTLPSFPSVEELSAKSIKIPEDNQKHKLVGFRWAFPNLKRLLSQSDCSSLKEFAEPHLRHLVDFDILLVDSSSKD